MRGLCAPPGPAAAGPRGRRPAPPAPPAPPPPGSASPARRHVPRGCALICIFAYWRGHKGPARERRGDRPACGAELRGCRCPSELLLSRRCSCAPRVCSRRGFKQKRGFSLFGLCTETFPRRDAQPQRRGDEEEGVSGRRLPLPALGGCARRGSRRRRR